MTATADSGTLFDAPDTPAAPKKRRGDNWWAVAALLYGPDHNVKDLSGGQVLDTDYNHGTYRPQSRWRTSNLPKSVLRSPHLAAARDLSDRLAAVHGSRATNSWIEAADVLLRVRGYHAAQIATLIDFVAVTDTLKERITNVYMLAQWVDIIITDSRFTEYAVQHGAGFTSDQVANARARRAERSRTTDTRPASGSTPTPTPSPPQPSSTVQQRSLDDTDDEPAITYRTVAM